jgi:uncharacterized RDD family membrane protein YckC
MPEPAAPPEAGHPEAAPAAPSLQKPADPPPPQADIPPPAQPAGPPPPDPAYGGAWATPASAYAPTLSSGSDYAQQSQPYPAGYGYPVTTVGGQPLAPQTDRLLARLIDMAILFVPNFIIALVLLIVPIIALVLARVEQPLWYVLAYVGGFTVALLVNLGTTYFYEVTYQHNKGQTFGKQKLRIRVVAVETGQPADTRELQKRFLAEYCVSIAMVIPVLGWLVASVASFYTYLNYLWCLWDKPYQQCLHDKYAKTVVIKVAE